MIFDSITHIDRYRGLGEGFAKAIHYIQENNVFEMPLGEVLIDGRAVYCFAKETQLVSENTKWEAHERYADIQLILSGAERIAYVPFSGQPVQTPYDDGKDCIFYEDGVGIEFTLRKGDFMIFLPGEPHRPDCPTQISPFSRKLVLKIKMQ